MWGVKLEGILHIVDKNQFLPHAGPAGSAGRPFCGIIRRDNSLHPTVYDMRDSHPLDLQRVHDDALQWLVESNVRTPDGGFRSIYKPATRAYENFNRGDTCLLVTSGATRLLYQTGHEALARQSAEHILGLQISHGHAEGAIPVGKNARFCVSSYMMFGAQALLQAYERTQDGRFLDAAVRAGTFVLDRMQYRDGSVVAIYPLERRYTLAARLLMPRQIWQVTCFRGFMDLHDVTGEKRFHLAAVRLGDWLRRQQAIEDGAFSLERYTLPSMAFTMLRNRNVSSALRMRRVRHPAANTYSIEVLLDLGRIDEARRSARWLAGGMGPNGLLYQFYHSDGERSVEEDVMPTAHLALLALDHPELGIDPDLPERAARGVAYAQVKSNDPNADGAMRGLPLHETRSDQVYTWDTIFSVRFLRRITGLEEHDAWAPQRGPIAV